MNTEWFLTVPHIENIAMCSGYRKYCTCTLKTYNSLNAIAHCIAHGMTMIPEHCPNIAALSALGRGRQAACGEVS